MLTVYALETGGGPVTCMRSFGPPSFFYRLLSWFSAFSGRLCFDRVPSFFQRFRAAFVILSTPVQIFCSVRNCLATGENILARRWRKTNRSRNKCAEYHAPKDGEPPGAFAYLQDNAINVPGHLIFYSQCYPQFRCVKKGVVDWNGAYIPTAVILAVWHPIN